MFIAVHSYQPKAEKNLGEFINRKMNKQVIVHAYNEQKRTNIDIYNSMDKSQNHKK